MGSKKNNKNGSYPIFFSLLNFKNQGGHELRILGIINELARNGARPILLSNAIQTQFFHDDIIHYDLNINLNKYQKSLLLLLTSILPTFLLKILYWNLTNKVFLIFKNNNLNSDTVCFFDNIDFSLGFLLLNQKRINNIIIDRPGIAHIEFDYKFNMTKNISTKFILRIKKLVSELLENLIIKYSSKIIVASQNMMDYYLKKYPNTSSNLYHKIPYYVDSTLISSKIDNNLKDALISKFEIKKEETVILFVGEFKRTGGVPDLIKAFISLYKQNKNIKLILIGGGYTYNQCEKIAKENEARDSIIFHNRIPYNDLRTYQDIAQIIVCPDRDNSFSRMIIHLKFWDALYSGKIVICSAFPPILEINNDEKLCINFIPSDINSLIKKLEYCIANKIRLLEKYSINQDYTKINFTYTSLRPKLLRIFNI